MVQYYLALPFNTTPRLSRAFRMNFGEVTDVNDSRVVYLPLQFSFESKGELDGIGPALLVLLVHEPQCADLQPAVRPKFDRLALDVYRKARTADFQLHVVSRVHTRLNW